MGTEEVPTPSLALTPILSPQKHLPVEYNPEQMDIIKKYIAPDCPEIELKFLVEKSKELGMSVIKNECYFVPQKTWNNDARTYTTKWSIQTSIDYYRKRGMNTGNVDSISCKPYYLRKDSKSGKVDEADWRNVTRLAYPPNPDFARCLIKKKDMSEPVECVVYWDEYVKKRKDGKPQAMWGKMPGNQLCKVAEAGCWRKAFPEMSGVYSSEEMEQATPSFAFDKKKEVAPAPEAVIEPPKKEEPKKAEQPKEDIPESEFISAVLEELYQCNSVAEINKWFESRQPELKNLKPENYQQLNTAYKKRLKEIQGEIKKAPQPEKKDPIPVGEPDPVGEQVAKEAKEELDKTRPPKKYVSTHALSTINRICMTLEDENKQPFMTEEHEIATFLTYAFKTKTVKMIFMEDAVRFIGRFNNYKSQKQLLDMYIKFRNSQT